MAFVDLNFSNFIFLPLGEKKHMKIVFSNTSWSYVRVKWPFYIYIFIDLFKKIPLPWIAIAFRLVNNNCYWLEYSA